MIMANTGDGERRYADTVAITEADRSELLEISDRMGLALNADEMLMLQSYFRTLQRNPTDIEIQAMAQAWSEHCCYKSSKFYLKKYLSGLSTDYTILAMEDDAGVVSFDDEYAYVIKMETHNHPSAVEPYGGAATGVGGILRDVLCMGAQPVALADSLFLGDVKEDRKYENALSPRFILNGIVSGIRDYGNRVGIPTVAGSVDFDASFDRNPLVNVGCVGIVRKDKVVRSRISKVGDILLLAGGRTGRDGIHGVTFASKTLNASEEESRRAVQLGNPIVKEPLIHAVLEANDAELIDGMKDLGGGGLSSSVGEMCYAGGTSARVELDKVLLKEENMKPWEIWISESQERMLLAVSRDKIDKISEIFTKWDVEFSLIGEVIDGTELVINFKSEKILELDLSFLTSGPLYCRNYSVKEKKEKEYALPPEPKSYNDFLMEFIGSLNNAARFNVVRQYDHTVRGDTVGKPFTGPANHETHSDSSIIKPLEHSFKGLVLTSGSKPAMVEADPYNGTLSTLSEAYRNILSSGGYSHSVIDSLNFGNPEEPEIMGQMVESVRAIGDFCRSLGLPVVSGNVSLYNQSGDKNIRPTPNIMIVGLIDDVRNSISPEFKREGSIVYLVGRPTSNLAGSLYLEYRGMKSETIDRPDLQELKLIGEKMKEAFSSNLILSSHDVSQGGIIQTLSEMTFGYGIGVTTDVSEMTYAKISAKLFAEGGNRMVVEVPAENEQKFLETLKDVDTLKIGITGGDSLIVNDSGREIINIPVEQLREKWESGLDNHI